MTEGTRFGVGITGETLAVLTTCKSHLPIRVTLHRRWSAGWNVRTPIVDWAKSAPRTGTVLRAGSGWVWHAYRTDCHMKRLESVR